MHPRFNPKYSPENLIDILWPRFSIADFEKAFAKEMGQQFGVMFPYGRTALIAILRALNLQNREIICPAYTCVVVPHAIMFSGNTPVFIDSDNDGFNMNLDLVEGAITPQTGAIIATSIFGYPVDVLKLKRIQERYPHVAIIQDCAHSFNCDWQGAPVNTAGLAAFYGMNISKITDSVFGGMITTNDASFLQKLMLMRESMVARATVIKAITRRVYFLLVLITFYPLLYGLVYWLTRTPLFSFLVKYYDQDKIEMPPDYLEMPSNFEASVGIAQLSRFQSKIKLRREVAAYYEANLISQVHLLKPYMVDGATYSHYTILTERREELRSFLLRNGVETGEIIEYSIPEMPAYQSFAAGSYPRAHFLKERTVNLPMYSLEVAQKTVGLVNEFFEKY